MSPAKKKAAPAPSEVWIVFVDHSALGVWLSRAKAEKAVSLRLSDSMLEVAYRIKGYREIPEQKVSR